MIHFDLPKEKSSIIKVIGVGGGGSNAVNHMFSQSIEGVNFIICNTDAQAIALSTVPNKVQLGPHLTQGLGAGANPTIGKQATEESLEEIRCILEVNTKMAFITAGMGGGTGTGGAPIIAKICRELGILTVGIVTTPFSYEGKKRQLQAEEGIRAMKQYVDTLLVISNDKLRHQFGNLKMKEAFAKADNVLATAAKCITDVINSTGQINVDFADVCTVMKNGGVAILGNAAARGENRAQTAIEEALNSPLLNDNEIRGAKWILININSAEGEHEFTMDEVEIIQTYLLSHAGENTDVILGLGYDNSLGDELSITLIATGFEYKDPFMKKPAKEAPKKDEKVVMVLDMKKQETTTPPVSLTPAPLVMLPPDERVEQEEETAAVQFIAETKPVLKDELQPVLTELPPVSKGPVVIMAKPVQAEVSAQHLLETTKKEYFELGNASIVQHTPANSGVEAKAVEANAAHTNISKGYLNKPDNIYAAQDEQLQNSNTNKQQEQQSASANPVLFVQTINPASSLEAETSSSEMQLVIKDPMPASETGKGTSTQPPVIPTVEELAMNDEVEEQKRKAAERIQKLRNLSFNVNNVDPGSEFETVPAYIRRNMELYNNVSPAENFYSNYEVKPSENNQASIGTLNTFLDGKKPD
jgi:cell division protein FtsZ